MKKFSVEEVLRASAFDRYKQDINTGGLAMPNENLYYSNLYYSQNGNPFYPYKIVYCYSDLLSSFYWFDKGLATYF